MEFETLQSIDVVEQLRAFVKNRIRLDGREFNSSRNVSVATSYVQAPQVYGSSFVKIGDTIVVCGINLLVGVPSIDAPAHGDIVTDVTLSLGCNLNSLDQRAKSSTAFELESAIIAVVVKGKMIDLEQLSIAKGKYAYRLCINVTCVSNAGNLTDAVILAAVAALCDTKLPRPVLHEDTIAVNSDVLRKLEVNHLSIPVTVGLFDHQVLLDPSLAEEEALHGLVTCSFALPSGSINYLHQSASEGSISRGQLETAVETARARAHALYELLAPQLPLV